MQIRNNNASSDEEVSMDNQSTFEDLEDAVIKVQDCIYGRMGETVHTDNRSCSSITIKYTI
eukprot:9022012-Ditylum_brightwellii.AAC.1